MIGLTIGLVIEGRTGNSIPAQVKLNILMEVFYAEVTQVSVIVFL